MSQKLPLPLPRLRGFGACADVGEAGEGVFPLRTLLPQAKPSHRPKPAHPTQAWPPVADSPTLHSDLPQQALPA
jgi:hypothetical protein